MAEENASPQAAPAAPETPSAPSGTCARHQRWLTVAIKRAQNIALLPFAPEL